MAAVLMGWACAHAASGVEAGAWIERLDDERFEAREEATAALLRMDDEVLPALRKALERAGTLEKQRRLTYLVERFSPGGEIWRRTMKADGAPVMLVCAQFALLGNQVLDRASGRDLPAGQFGFGDDAAGWPTMVLPDGALLCERRTADRRYAELGRYDPATRTTAWWKGLRFQPFTFPMYFAGKTNESRDLHARQVSHLELSYETGADGAQAAKFTLWSVNPSTGEILLREPLATERAPRAPGGGIPRRGWEDLARNGGFEAMAGDPGRCVAVLYGRRFHPGPGRRDDGFWTARVQCFETTTPSPRWTWDIPNAFGMRRLACDRETKTVCAAGVFAASEQKAPKAAAVLTACDLETGRELWRIEPQGRWAPADLAVSGGLAIAILVDPDAPAGGAQRMLALDARTGEVRWKKDFEGLKPAAGTPAAADLNPFAKGARIFAVRDEKIAFYQMADQRSRLAYADLSTGEVTWGPVVPKQPVVWTDTELFTAGTFSAVDQGFFPNPGARPALGGRAPGIDWQAEIPSGGCLYRLRPWPMPK
ncbi:MAG: PQQ-binding-like beta-propeller repeat protein [Planctomycetota bacterium]|nr:PQQ-binding-like beta-propeller repeat protein [Planctomycetota bacterium]